MSARLRHIVPLSLIVLAACKGSAAPAASASSAPALEPAVIDTRPPAPAKAGTPEAARQQSNLIPADSTKRLTIVSQGYALATAMMINRDARMLTTLYNPDAQLVLPDTTVQGVVGVVRRWIDLAQSKSLADFQRSSKRMQVLDDSTLSDSGSYVMTLKRSPRDTVLEKGTYVTRWRARLDAGKWVMLEDRIIPAAPAKGKSK